MEVKEAIEQIENYVKALDMIGEPESKLYTALKQVVPLLQQGEVYRLMWKELSAWHNKSGIGNLSEAIKILEQKYLKEAKQDEADNKG